jgi:uncharacterized protein YjiS (DUF1127 family)
MTTTRRAGPKRAARKLSDCRSTSSPTVLGLIFTSIEGRSLPGALTQQFTDLRPERQMAMMREGDSRAVNFQDRQHDGSRDLAGVNVHSPELSRSEAVAAARNIRPWHQLRALGRIPSAARRSIEKIIALPLQWRERARGRYHLQELSDHMLRDLGLSRADVEQEVSKWFWRE